MLRELAIRDFALIDRLELSFQPGFNVLTGETGAGKSIIIDAISLALGARASMDVVRAGASRAVIDAVFDVGDLPEVKALASELGIEDASEQVIITREVAREGRSASRVNGRPATVATLRRLAAKLVEIQGQHDFQRLFRSEEHRRILDLFGGSALLTRRKRFASLAAELLSLEAERSRLQGEARERLREIDLLRFQVEEIDTAELKAGEESALLERRTVMANAERLKEGVAEVHALLQEGTAGSPSVAAELGRVGSDLNRLAALDATLEEVAASLQETADTVVDAVREIRTYLDGLVIDPREQAAVEERIEMIRRLQRKYGGDVEEVLSFRDRAAAKLARLETAEETADALAHRIEELRAEASVEAAGLRATRIEAGRELERSVQNEFSELGMEAARFSVSLTTRPDQNGLQLDGRGVVWDRTGVDQVEFHFCANPGEPSLPLAAVASGGEAARLMLALQIVLAKADPVPTVILDEVDAGVGGRAAQAVGEKIATLAETHQVVCITHMATVAAHASTHIFVSKEERNERTVVFVKILTDRERADEIARMLSGDAGATSLAHARHLLDRPKAE